MAGGVGVLVCAGDQTAEALPTGERGASIVMGQCRGISVAVEVKRIEREYQYIIC